jgi:hypothetical protein
MAKGKSQSVVDYFECLTMLGPSSLGLLAASCGACYDGDDDAARLPRESALFPGSSGAGAVAAASKRIVKIFHCQRLGGSQMQPYESNRSAAALPGRTLPRARRVLKSWTRCDSLVLSRRFSIRRLQSVTSVTTSAPLLFPLAIASQILLQARCVLQRCNRLIAGATSVSAWQSSRCSITTC